MIHHITNPMTMITNNNTRNHHLDHARGSTSPAKVSISATPPTLDVCASTEGCIGRAGIEEEGCTACGPCGLIARFIRPIFCKHLDHSEGGLEDTPGDGVGDGGEANILFVVVAKGRVGENNGNDAFMGAFTGANKCGSYEYVVAAGLGPIPYDEFI